MSEILTGFEQPSKREPDNNAEAAQKAFAAAWAAEQKLKAENGLANRPYSYGNDWTDHYVFIKKFEFKKELEPEPYGLSWCSDEQEF